jgi:hypothetical protein
MKVIVEFGIALKLGYFMMDNATNNNTVKRGKPQQQAVEVQSVGLASVLVERD